MKMPINGKSVHGTMAMFGDKEQVLKVEGLALGEFDPSADGFYKNVQAFSFKVKKKKVINISIVSDAPVDVAVANEKGASVSYKEAVREGTVGPIPTGDNKEMGMVLGIYPGDKATVSVEVWMARS
ncbi:MAG: hypothetical protein FWG41_00360 [Methanomassiliicoccaceae archaeon]|nr:hypothetical protein [Methanomassiliicoccaceae archaeon]